MAFNLKQFRESTKKGFVQPNHYEIEFVGAPPAILKDKEVSNSFNNVKMKCFSTQLPGMVLDVIERRYHGPYRLIPVGFTFQQMPIMLYEDTSYSVRKLFDTWMYSIAEDRDLFVKYYDDIIAKQMNIYLYKRGFNSNNQTTESIPVRTYILEEVYPLSVSPVQLDWSANNTVMGVSVELQFHRWSVVDGVPLTTTNDKRAHTQNQASAEPKTINKNTQQISNNQPITPLEGGGGQFGGGGASGRW